MPKKDEKYHNSNTYESCAVVSNNIQLTLCFFFFKKMQYNFDRHSPTLCIGSYQSYLLLQFPSDDLSVIRPTIFFAVKKKNTIKDNYKNGRE